MGFSCKITDRGNSIIIELVGTLDSNTAPEFEAKVKPYWNGSVSFVVFDFGALEYLSSAGLRVFFATRKHVEARNGRVYFVNVPAHIQKVFDIINALLKENIFASVAQLDEYLIDIQKKAKKGKTEK